MPLSPNLEVMAAALENLFGGDLDGLHEGLIEIAWGTERAINKARLFGTDEIEAAAAHAAKVNSKRGVSVYFGAALRKTETPRDKRASKGDVLGAVSLWDDWDEPGQFARAREAYQAAKPNFGIITGTKPAVRTQAFWRISEAITSADGLERALAGLQAVLGGDPSVIDAARLMRLPGSVAWAKAKAGRIDEVVAWKPTGAATYDTPNLLAHYPPTSRNGNGTTGGVIEHGDFGRITDGRESYLREMVWAAVHNLAGDLNRWPTVDEVVADVWPTYSAKVASRVGDLDAEGRGMAALRQKATYAIRRLGETPLPEPEIPAKIEPRRLEARRFDAVTESEIPRRRWLLGHHLARGFVSATISPGGVGKSTLVFADHVALAVGERLLHDVPTERVRSWALNLEDSRDELLRRLYATAKSFAVDFDVVRDMVFVNSGHDQRVIVAELDRAGTMIATPDADALRSEIERHGIGYLSIDPFVRSHYLNENDNREIDFVMATLAEIATATNCAIELVHHVRKPPSGIAAAQAGNIDTARGASALAAAVRSARTVAPMTEAEAESFGIEQKNRAWFVRIDSAKANMRAPQETAEWCERVSVSLDNGDVANGDSVGGLRVWVPPSAWDGLTHQRIGEVLARIDAGIANGDRYSKRVQTGDRWVGTVLMDLAGRTKSAAKEILGTWFDTKILFTSPYRQTATRKERIGVFVDFSKAPGVTT